MKHKTKQWFNEYRRNNKAAINNAPRSVFPLNHGVNTSMRVGYLTPVDVMEVLPGDSFDFNPSFLAWMPTTIHPVMSNAYIDWWAFYVPDRILWDHFKQFHGESESKWLSGIEYETPKVGEAFKKFLEDKPATNFERLHYTLWDYFGYPCDIETANVNQFADRVNAFDFRAYQKIYNRWFMNQSLQDPILVNTSDTSSANESEELFKLRRVNKFRDYFTSATPAPVKGPEVMIPGLGQPIPVQAGNPHVDTLQQHTLQFVQPDLSKPPSGPVIVKDGVLSSDVAPVTPMLTQLQPSNLVGMVNGATMTAFVNAFKIWNLYQMDLYGTRYTEILRTHWNVISPDSSLQDPEYLGGGRTPIGMRDVTQTSSTDTTSPLGTVAGQSKTGGYCGTVHKSFTEHGRIMILAAVRTEQVYQEGLPKRATRSRRFDYFDPLLANIPNQAIMSTELYCTGLDTDWDEVYGYKPAWEDYRHVPSSVSGAFRSADGPAGYTSLDSWTYVNDFASRPVLSEEFALQDDSAVKRTLANQEVDPYQQVLVSYYFSGNKTSEVPVTSLGNLMTRF